MPLTLPAKRQVVNHKKAGAKFSGEKKISQLVRFVLNCVLAADPKTERGKGGRMNYHEELRRWIEATLEEKSWSAERWAREAGVAATNLTRFLNETDGRMLGLNVIAKLERAANSTFLMPARMPVALIPLLDRSQVLRRLERGGSMPNAPDTLPVPRELEDCVACRVDVSQDGYKQGQIAIISNGGVIPDYSEVAVMENGLVTVVRKIGDQFYPLSGGEAKKAGKVRTIGKVEAVIEMKR